MDSFNNVKRWIENIEDKTTPFVLIGNKSDKIDSRQVTLLEGQEFATKYGILFFETSCKLDIGIKNAFEKLIDKMLRMGKFDDQKSIVLGGKKSKQEKCCK